MENRKYECTRCGRPFQVKEEQKEPKCIHCGSMAVIVQPERTVGITSCSPRGRFT